MMKIDRWKLEFGSLEERIEQVYALSSEDLSKDKSIIDILRRNLTDQNNELLEISIMRLGVRAKDISSINKFIEILRTNNDPLVRSAVISALSSMYRSAILSAPKEARRILEAVREVDLNDDELQQVENEFVRRD